MKKTFVILLTTILAFVSVTFVSCRRGDKDAVVEKNLIEISAVTVDLYNPENKVAVDASKPSCVYDENGNKLTDRQWLLNSKFAKNYISSLGVGVFYFKYVNDTEYGLITLNIQNEKNPNYVFYFEPSEIGYYDARLLLPKLVKNPDSYQSANAEYDYKLLKKVETEYVEIDFENYNDKAFSSDVTEGEYKWCAKATVDGKATEHFREITMETQSEYVKRVMPTMIYDVKNKTYCQYFDVGNYILVDTSNANFADDDTQFNFNISNEEVLKQIDLGKNCATITLETINGDFDGVRQNGSKDNGLWITNNWVSWYYAIYSSNDGFVSSSKMNFTKQTVESNHFVYTVNIKLEKSDFNNGQVLQLKYTYGCQRECHVKIEFKEWNA